MCKERPNLARHDCHHVMKWTEALQSPSHRKFTNLTRSVGRCRNLSSGPWPYFFIFDQISEPPYSMSRIERSNIIILWTLLSSGDTYGTCGTDLPGIQPTLVMQLLLTE